MSLINKYPGVIIPFDNSKPRHERSLKEAKEYYKWYFQEMPKRRSILQSFLDFPLDFSDESLTKLDKWMWANLEPEPNDFIDGNKYPSAESTSYGMDIAFYLAETILKIRPTLYWKLDTARKSVSAFKPVLTGFNLPLNKHYTSDIEGGVLSNMRNTFLGYDKREGLLLEIKNNNVNRGIKSV